MTFACITPALIVGGFAERMKFWPLMLFIVLWSTIVYYPIAHMVWYWAGPDFLPANPNDHGFLFGKGALDFAGGTVVHINSGIAGLMGCLVLGKRIGYKPEPMRAALAADDLYRRLPAVGRLVRLQRRVEPGSERRHRGLRSSTPLSRRLRRRWPGRCSSRSLHKKPSLLGAATGAVVGLVAITPASGFAAPVTSIILGAIASGFCFFFVTKVKNALGYDDALDVFGVHCIGGIVGALGTAFVANPAWGGQGWIDYTVAPAVRGQVRPRCAGHLPAVGDRHRPWSGLAAYRWSLFYAIDKTIGLRPTARRRARRARHQRAWGARLQLLGTLLRAGRWAGVVMPAHQFHFQGQGSNRAP